MLNFFLTEKQIEQKYSDIDKVERAYQAQINRFDALLSKVQLMGNGLYRAGNDPFVKEERKVSDDSYYYLSKALNAMFDIVKGKKAEKTVNTTELTHLLKTTNDALEGQISFKMFSEQTFKEQGRHWEYAGMILISAMIILLLTVCTLAYTITLSPVAMLGSIALLATLDTLGFYFLQSKTGFSKSVTEVDRLLNTRSAVEETEINNFFKTELPTINFNTINQIEAYKPV